MRVIIKNYIIHKYLKFINLLHRPFVNKGVEDQFHAVFREFVSLSKQTDASVLLEIGSRKVLGHTGRKTFSHCEDYVGLDILAGEGVDVVGDAHKLSENFPLGYFDFIYSISVFEHLLFPWKAALEINKVMKTGGYVFLSTHPVWPTHELPWDFWRFQCNGFHALFNKFTGFEIISLAEGLPCKSYSLIDDAPTRDLYCYTMNQGVALIARKTGDYRSDLLKWDIEISDVVNTMYPDNRSD